MVPKRPALENLEFQTLQPEGVWESISVIVSHFWLAFGVYYLNWVQRIGAWILSQGPERLRSWRVALSFRSYGAEGGEREERWAPGPPVRALGLRGPRHRPFAPQQSGCRQGLLFSSRRLWSGVSLLRGASMQLKQRWPQSWYPASEKAGPWTAPGRSACSLS